MAATTIPEPRQTMQRFRAGGYGAMVESETGSYVRADDVLELLQLLRHHLPESEQKKAQTLIVALGGH